MYSLSAPDTAVDRAALATQAYERILSHILEGSWPAGQRLNIDQIARGLQVSITPVREALARLSAQRLIQFEPYKGYSVLPAMDAAQATQLFEARLLIEIHALRVGVERIEPAQLDVMRASVERIRELAVVESRDIRAMTDQDQAFHHTIVAAAGNSYLMSMYEVLVPLIHLGRLRTLRRLLPSQEYDIIDEHAAIVAAYERRDVEEAEVCLRRHLRQSRARVSAQMAVEAASDGEPSPDGARERR